LIFFTGHLKINIDYIKESNEIKTIFSKKGELK